MSYFQMLNRHSLTFNRLVNTVVRFSDKPKIPKICTVEECLLRSFDETIDVRTHEEFCEDRVPWSLNAPVLDSFERAVVGRQHAVNVFEGHKTGASLVSANISRLLNERFVDKKADYRPLIYCWRGGMRSHSLALVLANVGFDVYVMEGGYKAFREKVREDLESLSATLSLLVISGPTGSGKSALLRQLRRSGEKVLDLEALAKHKGSVLGRYPDEPQPTQKRFESLLWEQLRTFGSADRVWIESESRRIGNVLVPNCLFERMRTSPRIELSVPFKERVRHTVEEYDYFVQDPEALKAALLSLTKVAKPEFLQHWLELIDEKDWNGFVASLLINHYDPTYALSQKKNSANCSRRERFIVDSLDKISLKSSVVPSLVKFCDNLL